MVKNSKYIINIGWLYPELMSTYGDRGNILVLRKRCEWRNIKTQIINISTDTRNEELKNIDLLFGGGAQDREQEIVMNDLKGKTGETLKELIENELPALFVCGSPQLMGKYYEPAAGERIEGLGIFDMHTKHPGERTDRCIGNVVIQPDIPELNDKLIVGFENHGGRTYLGKSAKPFAKVVKGYGNNGHDGTEGAIYKNAIGTYLHGPLLPKNPEIADYFIKKALEVKLKDKIDLEKLDDSLEQKAKRTILQRLKIT